MIKLFTLKHCPHCIKAKQELSELLQEERFAHLQIEEIEEQEQAEIANQYDYYYVPSFFINEKKVHEGKITKDEIQSILEMAIHETSS